MNSATLKDYRFYGLALALLALLGLFAHPDRQRPVTTYDLTVIVDITRSMNAEDYRIDNQPVSRLTYVKHTLRELIVNLPCQSKFGLGIFTERRVALMFEPLEVCSARAELDSSIAALDWRMAWAADSRIGNGLLNALQQLVDKQTALLFISDGQEAPPLNPRYRTDFNSVRGKVNGLIGGAGGLQPVAIPKFDPSGRRNGVYGPDDVPHRSSFGESDLNPEKIEGYDARNAPFGRAAASGSEHLSALQEGYLQQLAAETGLGYERLEEGAGLQRAVATPAFAHTVTAGADIRWYWGVAALIGLLLAVG